MRTTVSLDDQLLQQAKQLAVTTGRTMSQVLDDALRVFLSKQSAESRSVIDLPAYGGSGLQPGVDLEDRDALAELLDTDGPERAAV
jgi:hypothetical protein